MNKIEYAKAKKKLGFDPLTEKPDRALLKSELELCFLILKWKHEDKAKNCNWLKNNGYGSFVYQVRRTYGLWTTFIKSMGEEPVFGKAEPKSKKEIEQKWRKELLPKHGEKAKSCRWLKNNGYSRFVYQVFKIFGSWLGFIKSLGETPLLNYSESKEELIQYWRKELLPKHGEKAKNNSWLRNNGYWSFIGRVRTKFGTWFNFLKAINEEPLVRKPMSPEELLQHWRKELYPKHGERAKSCNWLKNNKCEWFVNQARRIHGKWSRFIFSTQGHFEIPIEKMEIYK